MRHKYDKFQKIPGGSTIWRACVSGRYKTERMMQELAEQSKIQFYAINISLLNHLVTPSVKSAKPLAPKAAANG
jgi:coproporphyrinogen III oxidase